MTHAQMLYSPAEAARLLSLSRSTIYELMANGAIAFVKIGSARRIRAEALDLFLTSLDAAAAA